ncbi:MAG: acetyl-CoA C-acyltransferase [Porticoccaceae bacterium]|nr:acetyl-CoA C-acyltransferase [Porticoccaceae bacterium]
MSQREVVVVSGARTAIGDFGGSLKDVCPGDLGATVVAEAVKRAGIASEEVEHCVIGNVIHSERKDMYISRVAALRAGLSEKTPCLTVNRLCGSGLQSIISATQLIMLGDANTAVAGGAESMSRAPYWLPTARFGQRMGDGAIIDPMTGALTCPMGDVHMGVTAENVAEQWGVSREDQDALAVESHNRAERAVAEGRFDSQIVPVEVKTRKGSVMVDKDEHIRAGARIDDMTKLRPAFKKDGSVTAGNASGINDGAAAVVLMERSLADEKGLKPLAKVAGYAFAALDPSIMGMGPVPAVKTLLARAGLTVADIDVWEVNEAFAAQALAVCRDLDLPADKVNPNGSGISLGHPIGASGTIIAVKALYELQRVGGRYAVATMCIGGGQGIAVLFEAV